MVPQLARASKIASSDVLSCICRADSLSVRPSREVVHLTRSVLRRLRSTTGHKRLDHIGVAGGLVACVSLACHGLIVLLILEGKGQLRHQLRFRRPLACQLILLLLLDEVHRLIAVALSSVATL